MSTRQRTARTARRRGALACVLVGLALLAGCGAEPTPATVQAQQDAAIAQAAAETAAIAERSAAQVEQARTDVQIVTAAVPRHRRGHATVSPRLHTCKLFAGQVTCR